jgi:NAD(P)H-dependent flavin oxidoreductase YrpB (nitropropane dioxygenase family)
MQVADQLEPQLWRNRITALFGIRHPILLGGMQHLSRADVVAAVVNAGGMGFITPRSFDSLNDYRDNLRRCRDLTQGRAFGVNLTISRRAGFNSHAPAWIDIALEEGVRHFESAGTSPDDIVAPIHAGGAVLLHKCPTVRHALTAERLGVDAVALVGLEEGGHPGANQLSTFVSGAVALQRLQLPVVLGGGIGCGAQIAAAMALGAEGVVMGSRFMVASEVEMHEAVKQRIVSLDEHGSMAILGTLNDTWRVMVNETAREVQRLEAAGARRHEAFGDLILSTRTLERVYRGGRVEEGIVSLGPAGGFADAIEPAGDILNRLMREARAAMQMLAARSVGVVSAAMEVA